MWFTNLFANAIVRVTPTGVRTTFSAPSINDPEGIAAGSDGNLWFTNAASNTIGRITPAGVVTTFTGTGPGLAAPRAIAAGPDGNRWFLKRPCP